ncbi:MAG: TauD/TfdA family dioxygenase [Pseudomonadota bacterium]
MEKIWNEVRVVDASAESGPVRDTPATALKWLAADLSDDHWKVALSDRAIDEIITVANAIEAQPESSSQRTEPWPDVHKVMALLKAKVDAGPGFAVLHGLPVDAMSDETLVELYWRLGQKIAPAVAQKWNGEMIYSVRDTGQTYGYGVRGSRTSVELVFHVDNAFGIAVPDYVGLLCKQPAKHGGVSRFCSLYSVHERLQRHYPAQLARLYEPMLFDRQKEHADNAPQVLLAPFFSWRADKLFARANASLVHKGYEVANIPMDTALKDALDAVTQVCESGELWYEAPLERGHIQYLNNHEVAHYRSEFEDFEEPHKKRHLYRLWHRNSGHQSYDGIAA